MAMTLYGNVFALILAACFFQAAVGVLGIWLPLEMAALGWSNVQIGATASSYAAGFILGAFFTPRFLKPIGHIRAFAAAGALGCVATLALYAIAEPWAWTILRGLGGFVVAGMFAVAESWIADATEPQDRGRVLSAYIVSGRIGLIGAPFLVASAAAGAPEPYMLAGGLLAFALIPVAGTRRHQPQPPENVEVDLPALARIAPAAMVSAFVAGFVNSGVLAFAPLYAAALNPEGAVERSAVLIGAAYMGSLLAQWPAGWLSDRIDRRWVIAGLGAVAALAAGALAFSAEVPAFAIVLAGFGLWGAGSFSYYSLAIAHAADRSHREDLPRMTAALTVVWAVGSVLGPIVMAQASNLLGLTMGVFGPAALLAALLVVAMLVRRVVRPSASQAMHEDYAPAVVSSLFADMDPRAPDDVAACAPEVEPAPETA
ncbi:MAG: MFS transporter [Maricaulaceae bacterium]